MLAGLPLTTILDGDDSLRRRPVARIIEPLRSMGADARGPAERLPSSPDRDRSYPAPGDRLRDAGAERAGEVGDPAGRAAGRRADDGPRVGRDARPHGADAAGARACRSTRTGRGRRGGRDRGRRRGGGAGGRRAGPGRRLGGGLLAGRRRDPSRRRADACATSASTRPAARSSTSCARMGADIDERRRSTAAPTTASASRWPTSPSARRRCTRSTSGRPTWPRRSTRSRSCASRPPWRDGTTVIRGAGELRHKESDRIAGIVDGPAALGARIEVDGDDIRIDGGRRASRRRDRQPRRPPTGDDLRDRRARRRRAHHDRRGPASAAISYPGFFDDLERVRA